MHDGLILRPEPKSCNVVFQCTFNLPRIEQRVNLARGGGAGGGVAGGGGGGGVLSSKKNVNYSPFFHGGG